MRVIEDTLLDAVPMDGTLTTRTQEVFHLWGCFFQVYWDGNPVGTITLQQSAKGQVWDDVENSNFSCTGVAGSTSYNFDGIYSKYIRLKYVHTSGSGFLTVDFNAKGV